MWRKINGVAKSITGISASISFANWNSQILQKKLAPMFASWCALLFFWEERSWKCNALTASTKTKSAMKSNALIFLIVSLRRKVIQAKLNQFHICNLVVNVARVKFHMELGNWRLGNFGIVYRVIAFILYKRKVIIFLMLAVLISPTFREFV